MSILKSSSQKDPTAQARGSSMPAALRDSQKAGEAGEEQAGVTRR